MTDILTYGLVGKWYLFSGADRSLAITVLILSALLLSAVAYLLGSLNFAIIISGKAYRQDIRDFGSKNAGMTNMMRTYGRRAAGLTLLGDALKAAVSCTLGYVMWGQKGAYLAGVFCIVGHMFPLYYHFRGGKGVVTAAVSILMCNPIVFLILFVLFVAIVLASKYISLGSIMCMLLYPIILDRVDRSALLHEVPPEGSPNVLFAFIIMALVVWKHRENIKRLWTGTENKFSFKKSVKTAQDTEENDLCELTDETPVEAVENVEESEPQ